MKKDILNYNRNERRLKRLGDVVRIYTIHQSVSANIDYVMCSESKRPGGDDRRIGRYKPRRCPAQKSPGRRRLRALAAASSGHYRGFHRLADHPVRPITDHLVPFAAHWLFAAP